MKNSLVLGSLALFMLPVLAGAAPAKMMHHPAAHKMTGKKMAATMYQCQKCHMQVSAATAKKDGYKDPMDGGKLVPMLKK